MRRAEVQFILRGRRTSARTPTWQAESSLPSLPWQVRGAVAAGRAADGGLQLGVLDGVAAGGEVEILAADSRVDVVHLRVIARKGGFGERGPDAVGSARPAVAEAGGAALVEAFAVAAEILN